MVLAHAHAHSHLPSAPGDTRACRLAKVLLLQGKSEGRSVTIPLLWPYATADLHVGDQLEPVIPPQPSGSVGTQGITVNGVIRDQPLGAWVMVSPSWSSTSGSSAASWRSSRWRSPASCSSSSSCLRLPAGRLHRTSNAAASRSRSRDDAPTRSSNSPGSTWRSPAESTMVQSATGSRRLTRAVSPGARST